MNDPRTLAQAQHIAQNILAIRDKPTGAGMKEEMTTAKHSHYFHDVSHLQQVDIYRMLQLLGIADPALQHAFKKVAAAGKRGAKSAAQDVQEAIDSLVRWQAMAAEDAVLQARERKEAGLACTFAALPAAAFEEGGAI